MTWLNLKRRDFSGALLAVAVVLGAAALALWHGYQTGAHLPDPNWRCVNGPKGMVCDRQPGN